MSIPSTTKRPAGPAMPSSGGRPTMSDMQVRAAALMAASSYRLSALGEEADRRAVLDRAELFAEWIRTGRTSGQTEENR